MRKRQALIFGLLAVLILASFYERGYFERLGGHQGSEAASEAAEKLAYAFDNRLTNLQIQGSGIVEKVLSDDTKGRRHQRIIVRVGEGQTILIAHNIDLAPRIQQIKKNDHLEFFGEYEWNSKGGVIHWTHRDPAQKHVDGWLKHEGKIYQ